MTRLPTLILKASVTVCCTTNPNKNVPRGTLQVRNDDMEITITKENFDDEVRNYKGTVLLDLWADWCGPCMMLAPIVEEIAEEYDGKVKVGKINVDEQPELAMAFRCESIPMLVLVKDGAVHNMTVGYRDKNDVIKMIEA